MVLRSTFLALIIGAASALSLGAPAHADGFNLGTFMGGISWQVPKCKAPDVLRELRDSAGRSQWRCVRPDQASNAQGEVKSASAAPH